MITHNDTCFSILLDHEDINGCVDIAKFGVEAMMKHTLARELIQSIAEFIVAQATEQAITFDPDQASVQAAQTAEGEASEENGENEENEEPVEGQALMTIQRLISLEQTNKRRK